VAHYGKKRLPAAERAAIAVREQTDPFALTTSIDRQLVRLATPASRKGPRECAVLEQSIPSPQGGDDRPQTPRPTSYAG
jgi:hypothetical protein